MALRDTSWVLDTAGAVKEANGIVVTSTATQEGIIIVPVGSYTRNRTKETKVWTNLTEAAAQKVVDTRAGDTNTRWQMQEKARYLGAYELTRTVDSRGAWS